MSKKIWTLGNIVEARSGHTFRSAVEPQVNGAIKVVQIKDVHRANVIDMTTLTAIHWVEKSEPPLLVEGDILIKARGNNNEASLYQGTEAVVASNQFFVLRLRTKQVLPDYLCWVLNHPVTQASLQRQQSGTAIKAITRATLMGLVVPIPDLAKQQRIAALQALWLEEDRLQAALQQNRQKMILGIYQGLMK